MGSSKKWAKSQSPHLLNALLAQPVMAELKSGVWPTNKAIIDKAWLDDPKNAGMIDAAMDTASGKCGAEIHAVAVKLVDEFIIELEKLNS